MTDPLEGDTLVVWQLDRLGRTIQHLIQTMTLLEARKISFKCLQESIDTATSGGKLIFRIFNALAEFERDLIRERTHAGLKPHEYVITWVVDHLCLIADKLLEEVIKVLFLKRIQIPLIYIGGGLALLAEKWPFAV